MNIGEKPKGYQFDAPESFPPDETDKTIILRENFRLSGSTRFPVSDGYERKIVK